jgi:CheY-like chemotaxis protein
MLDDLDQIRVATRRAAELCAQMLAYSGRARFSMRNCRLDSLVNHACAALATTLPKAIDLQLKIHAANCAIHGDPEQVSRLLTSLVENAVEAMGNDGGHIVVEVSEAYFDQQALAGALFTDELKPGNYLVLQVSDDGCGMDSQTLARIYDPFFSTKFAGRGLGIPAALGIARAHQGTILFASQPNQGTVARVLVPTVNRNSVNASVLDPAGVEPRKVEQTVLLVDDDEAVRLIGKRILEQAGYAVILARDGIDALVMFARRSGPIDLLVLDVTMPQLDGIETLRALRALDPIVAVIMTSGYASGDFSERLAEMGEVKFLQKPFAPRDLLVAVREVLEVGCHERE